MGILNVTPDSFSDGGRFVGVDNAMRQAEKMIAEGADIIDVGGESTRPGGEPVPLDREIERTVPVIAELVKRFDTPISIDTTKSGVARSAIEAGAEIVNDISGLRFDDQIADVAAASGAGLILMHSRGQFETMHSQPPVTDERGVDDAQIVLDVGLGFGKTFEQNLELLADLDKIVNEFQGFPLLVGASRKSFIGRILGDVPAPERIGGSIAAALIAVRAGAGIVRVHDVRDTVQALRVASRISEVDVRTANK
jgi:dihydropteroate synthase